MVGYLIYTMGASGAWLVYAVLAMMVDSFTENDVPGVGYLIVGLVGWMIGSGIFLERMATDAK